MNKQMFKDIAKEISSSKVFRVSLYTLGFFVVACLVFQAGAVVGFHKASFGSNWGDNYVKNFGPSSIQMTNIIPENFPNAHGAVGRVINIEPPTMIVEDKDNTEKVILITDKTQIRTMHKGIKKEDLDTDDFVVVIGSPNAQGQIEAKLIRILPEPLEGFNKDIPSENKKQNKNTD